LKPPKAKPKVQRKKEHPTLFAAQNSSSNIMAKILLVFDFFNEEELQPLSRGWSE
jgi:hypothetical protein